MSYKCCMIIVTWLHKHAHTHTHTHTPFLTVALQCIDSTLSSLQREVSSIDTCTCTYSCTLHKTLLVVYSHHRALLSMPQLTYNVNVGLSTASFSCLGLMPAMACNQLIAHVSYYCLGQVPEGVVQYTLNLLLVSRFSSHWCKLIYMIYLTHSTISSRSLHGLWRPLPNSIMYRVLDAEVHVTCMCRQCLSLILYT